MVSDLYFGWALAIPLLHHLLTYINILPCANKKYIHNYFTDIRPMLLVLDKAEWTVLGIKKSRVWKFKTIYGIKLWINLWNRNFKNINKRNLICATEHFSVRNKSPWCNSNTNNIFFPLVCHGEIPNTFPDLPHNSLRKSICDDPWSY